MGIAIWVFRKSRNYVVGVISMAVPLLAVVGDVVVKCQSSPTSEACVWGKSFLPLTIGAAIMLATPLIYLVLTGIKKLCLSVR